MVIFFPFFITLFFYPPELRRNYHYYYYLFIYLFFFFALDPFQSSTQNFPPEIPPPRWPDPGPSLVLTVEWSGYSRSLVLVWVLLLCLFLFIYYLVCLVWFGLVFYFTLFYSPLLAVIILYLILFLILLLLALALPLRFFLSSLPLLTVYQCPPNNTTIRSLSSIVITTTISARQCHHQHTLILLIC